MFLKSRSNYKKYTGRIDGDGENSKLHLLLINTKTGNIVDTFTVIVAEMSTRPDNYVFIGIILGLIAGILIVILGGVLIATFIEIGENTKDLKENLDKIKANTDATKTMLISETNNSVQKQINQYRV